MRIGVDIVLNYHENNVTMWKKDLAFIFKTFFFFFCFLFLVKM